MATFFGEILPISSRAVDDDDDDYEASPQGDPVLVLSKKVRAELEKAEDKRIPCDNLVIALGQEANAFTEVYVKTFKYELIGGLFTSLTDADPCTLLQTAPTDKTCFLYRCYSNPNIIVVQCTRTVTAEQSFEWAKQLCATVHMERAYICVLCSMQVAGFTSQKPVNDLDTPFLRALKTDKFVAHPVCPVLEQPNMLTGLAAQLMTFFQVHSYKCVCYICYTDARHADIPGVKVFMPVLQATPIKDMTEVRKNAEEMLRDIVEKHETHHSLYL